MIYHTCLKAILVIFMTKYLVDGSGNPFVYASTDSAVAMSAVDAVRALAQSEFPVTIEASEVEGDDGDALRFIDFLETNTSGTGACTMVSPTEDTDLAPWGVDGHDDAFPRLVPGTGVCSPVPTYLLGAGVTWLAQNKNKNEIQMKYK